MKVVARLALMLSPMAVLAIMWEFLAARSHFLAFLIGRPSIIFSNLIDDVGQTSVLTDLGVTLATALCGLVLGCVCGYALGLLVATRRNADLAFAPIINMLSVIPLFAVGPLIVFIAGQGVGSKILLSFATVSFLAIALTYQHAKLAPSGLKESVFIQSGRMSAVLRYVEAPYAALRLVTNLRSLFGMAVAGALIGEFLGSSHGIGRYIVVAEGLFDVNRIWVGVFLLSVSAIIIGLGLAKLESLARARL
jgi:NitT/TauT family transport system permease protein